MTRRAGIAAVAVALLAVAASAVAIFGRRPASVTPSAAWRRGASDAEADVAAGRARILVVGGKPRGFPGELDPATGLPTEAYACCAEGEEREYVDGFNAAMAKAVAEGRLGPPSSLRDRVTARDALARAFAGSEGGPPIPFSRNAAPLAAPDGFHRIEARPWGEGGDRYDLLVVDLESGHARTVAPIRAPVRLLFDPTGRTLWVEDGDAFLTVDLATARVLQSFYD